MHMWPGRNAGQKRELIEGINRVFEGLGIPAEAVSMLVHQVPEDGLGRDGVPAADRGPRH
jgi:4-oxalocrotonate tautomerase